MEQPTPIPELLAAAKSSNASIAGPALREILIRHKECDEHLSGLIDLLRNSNAAISDYAFLTLERLGETSVAPLVTVFHQSNGKFRRLVMGLIAGISRFDVYFPLLKNEIDTGDTESRIWAANCLGRNYRKDVNWPSDAIELLNTSIDILESLRTDGEHWPQARMTLKQLGVLPNSTN